MRWIEIPKSPGSDEETKVEVHDPDPEGVSHVYQVYGKAQGQWEPAATIRFKKTSSIWSGGGAATEESLLVVLIDRFQGVLKGKGFTQEKASALAKLEEALVRLRAVSGTVTQRIAAKAKETKVEPVSTPDPLENLNKHVADQTVEDQKRLDLISVLKAECERLKESNDRLAKDHAAVLGLVSKPKKAKKPKT